MPNQFYNVNNLFGTIPNSSNIIFLAKYFTYFIKYCLFTAGSITINQFLSQAYVPVITNLACLRSYPFVIQSTNICTSGTGGSSTCGGDSGGPLVVQRGGLRILVSRSLHKFNIIDF